MIMRAEHNTLIGDDNGAARRLHWHCRVGKRRKGSLMVSTMLQIVVSLVSSYHRR